MSEETLEQLEAQIAELKAKEVEVKNKLALARAKYFMLLDEQVVQPTFFVWLPEEKIKDEKDAHNYLNFRYPYDEIVEIEIEKHRALMRVPKSHVRASGNIYERRVTSPAPDIDLDRLKDLDEELYNRVTSVEANIVLDEVKLQTLINEDVMTTLEQVLTTPKPVVSLHAIKEK